MNNEFISSKANPKIKQAASLKQGDPERFLVEGHHLVEMAYESHCLEEVFALEDPHLEGIKTTLVTPEIIEKLSLTKSPEGIVGVSKKKKGSSLEGNRALLLDRVQDPGNVGTLLRTALAFGFANVLSLQGSASFYNPKTVMASQGAIFRLNLTENLKEEEALSLLRKDGYLLWGSALKNSKDFHEVEVPEGKLCLILGNEGKGMSQSLLSQTDLNLYIPIEGIDSLNVGVAGGILMDKLKFPTKLRA